VSRLVPCCRCQPSLLPSSSDLSRPSSTHTYAVACQSEATRIKACRSALPVLACPPPCTVQAPSTCWPSCHTTPSLLLAMQANYTPSFHK
jgi:hypothetical protein